MLLSPVLPLEVLSSNLKEGDSVEPFSTAPAVAAQPMLFFAAFQGGAFFMYFIYCFSANARTDH